MKTTKIRFKNAALRAGIVSQEGSTPPALARAAAAQYPELGKFVTKMGYCYGPMAKQMEKIADRLNPTPDPPRPPKPVQKSRRLAKLDGTSFYASSAWQEVRYRVLARYGARCQCCGATPADGVKMHVDHIKPRFHHPELSLDENNLQVLCEPCNLGKRHLDDTDWRPVALTHAS